MCAARISTFKSSGIQPRIRPLLGRHLQCKPVTSSKALPNLQEPIASSSGRHLQSSSLWKTLQQTAPAFGLALASLALTPEASTAFQIQTEPANALSLPTWAIHVSSVLEWVTAMGLMWKYAEVSGNERWKGMTWAMMPCLGSAMSACTWHFFYNSPDLEFLVALQAALTVAGNCTCWLAAYRIYEAAQAEQASS